MSKVTAELKLPPMAISKWKKYDATFGEALQRAVADHVSLVEAMLVDGEARAAATLVEALSAVDKSGSPRWTTRVDAAITLLDRAGMRGKAVDRQAVSVSSTTRRPEEIEESLRKALRDPSVRAWLKDTGGMKLLEGVSVGDVDEVVKSEDVVIEEVLITPTEEVA